MPDVPEVLYHGTVADHLPSIYREGLSADYSSHLRGIYLTDDPDVAEYFAERTAEWGGDPVIIAVPVTPELRRGLRGDRKMLMRPILPHGYDPKAVAELLASHTTSWVKTLEAVHSVVYRGSDPIQVTPGMVTPIRRRRFNRFPVYRRSAFVHVRRHWRIGP